MGITINNNCIMIPVYYTRERWLRGAVDKINEKIFGGKLNMIEYQITMSILPKTTLGNVVFPYNGEDVSGSDFFPPSIHINETIRNEWEIVMTIAHECIHCFMDIRNHNKRFEKEAAAIGFEKPFKSLQYSDDLLLTCKEIAAELGDFPGKPISIKPKGEKKNKFSGVIFCPECGYELKIKEKIWKQYNEALPTCTCGCKMAMDLSDGEEEE